MHFASIVCYWFRDPSSIHLSENMCRSQEGRHLGASIHPVDLSSPANSRSLSRLFRGPLKPMAPLQLLCGTRMSVTTVLSHASLTWSFSITGRGWCSYHLYYPHSRSYFLLRFAQLFVTRSKDSVVPTTSLSYTKSPLASNLAFQPGNHGGSCFSTHFVTLINPLTLTFLGKYNLAMLPLVWRVPFMDIIFRVFLSRFASSSLVHSMIPALCQTSATASYYYGSCTHLDARLKKKKKKHHNNS